MLTSKFTPLSQLIESSIAEYSVYPLQEFIHRVLTRFGVLAHVSNADDAVWQMTVLNTFFSFIKEECAKTPRTSLARLMEIIETMEHQGLQLQAERVFFDKNGVNFITTHSSKGLEFETVYILGCNDTEWEGKKTRSAFIAPPNLLISKQAGKEGELEELRRLFYVAMTRAERELIISYAARTDNDKQLARSCFVAELERTGTVRCNEYQLEKGEMEEAMMCCLQETPEGHDDLFTSDLIGERLKEYKLSVSHLNSYLKCPRTFFFESVLRVPQSKNAAMSFGTSVHNALEHVFKLMQQSADGNFPPRQDFIASFIWEMQRNLDSFTEVEFVRRLKGGEETLGQFYDLNAPLWHKNVLLEKSFQTMLDEAIPLNGLVDKLELFGNKVNLVDYKTGKFSKSKFQVPDPVKVHRALSENREPKHEDLHGGDYWRQAVFYKLLVEHNPTNSYQVESTTFCHVEPDEKNGEYINQKVEITPEDEEIVRDQIRGVYGSIINREFDGTCSSQYCQWCRG